MRPTTRAPDVPGLVRRTISSKVAKPSLRAAEGEGGADVFVGHSAVFSSRTLIGSLAWGFFEELLPECFTDTLADAGASRGVNQAFLIDHDSYYVVARESAGTLRHVQDSIGLAVEADLDLQVSYISDLRRNVANGNITGMSIGFWPEEVRWSIVTIDTDAGPMDVDLRQVVTASLLESSAVTFPQYTDTDAGLRDVAEALRAADDDSLIMRHAAGSSELAKLLGVSKREAATPSLTRERQRARHKAYATMFGFTD